MFKRTLEPEKILFIWNEMPNPIPNIRQFLLGHPYVDLDIHKRQTVYGKNFTKWGIIRFKLIMFTVYILFALSSVIFVNYWHAGKTGGGLGFNIFILIYLISLSCIGLHGSICLKAASKSVNELKFSNSRYTKESFQSGEIIEFVGTANKNTISQKTQQKSHRKRK